MSKVIVTQEILGMISRIDRFSGAWTFLRPLFPLDLLREQTVASSIGALLRFEGEKVLQELVLKTLEKKSTCLRPKWPHTPPFLEENIAGMAEALETIAHEPENWPLTSKTILTLHQKLFLASPIQHPPFEIFPSIEGLLSWTRNQQDKASLHPLLLAAIFYGVFLSVDPYQAGHLRLASLLNQLLLAQGGYPFIFYASFEKALETHEEDYLKAFHSIQAEGTSNLSYERWIPFYLGILENLIQDLEAFFQKKEAELFPLKDLSGQILKTLQQKSPLSIYQITQITRANRNTLKKHLASLCREGKITPSGKGKLTVYTLAN